MFHRLGRMTMTRATLPEYWPPLITRQGLSAAAVRAVAPLVSHSSCSVACDGAAKAPYDKRIPSVPFSARPLNTGRLPTGFLIIQRGIRQEPEPRTVGSPHAVWTIGFRETAYKRRHHYATAFIATAGARTRCCSAPRGGPRTRCASFTAF